MSEQSQTIRQVQTQSRYYKAVAPEQLERLENFRREHPYRQVESGGQTWEYLAAGESPEVVLLLPGAMGTGESAWQTMIGLRQHFRVIAVSYPAVNTMAELVDGIAQILTREGVEQAHVVGGSYGGFVAQVFARRHLDRVRTLVVSHAGPPDPTRAQKIQSAIRIVSLLPLGMVRSLFRSSMGKLLPQGHPESPLQEAYFQEVVDTQLQKANVVSGYRRAIDFDQNYKFSPADLAGWPGRILLVMADNDPGTPEAVRAEMVRLYPGARVHLFSGTGHAAAVTQRAEYLAVLEEFMKGEA